MVVRADVIFCLLIAVSAAQGGFNVLFCVSGKPAAMLEPRTQRTTVTIPNVEAIMLKRCRFIPALALLALITSSANAQDNSRYDVNLDGVADVADVTDLVNYLNGGAPVTTGPLTIMLPDDVPMSLVTIPAGSFIMGSPETERSRSEYEGSTHTVTLTRSFDMCETEISQQQWLALMGSWPGLGLVPSSLYGLGDIRPAYYVSWEDAQDYVAALNQHVAATSQGAATFRLPSEAEWEYTCRAGTTTRYYFGDSLSVLDSCADGLAGVLPGNRTAYMWYCGNGGDPGDADYGTKDVGTRLPNQFGLRDMSGNVSEWCQDWWSAGYPSSPQIDPTGPTTGTLKVYRGGDNRRPADICRSAMRNGTSPDSRHDSVGFRLVRTR